MRILIFLGRAAPTLALIYAVYSAAIGLWPRATFFLVLYHIGFNIAILIEQASKDALRKIFPGRYQ